MYKLHLWLERIFTVKLKDSAVNTSDPITVAFGESGNFEALRFCMLTS